MTHSIDNGTPIEECPMCGGTGGWPGIDGWVVCKPCNGTGVDRPQPSVAEVNRLH
jgi:DnaJ-class molecular chaperone